VREKRFREDLFYRIHVAVIEIPPLRERGEDVALLAGHFVQQYAAEMGKEGVTIDPEALEVLSRYPWPGNVRELQNVVKRTLAMLPRNTITPEDLPEDIVLRAVDRPAAERGGFFELRNQRIASFEREFLISLLRTHRGDVTGAAREARIPRATFYRLLNKHEIHPDEFRA